MDVVDSTLAEADRAWRRYGISPADREALVADLRADLQEAAADGVSPAQLLGSDIGEFARRTADEAGLQRVASERERLLGTSLAGAGIGAAIAAALLTAVAPLLHPGRAAAPDIPIQAALGIYYGVPAAIVLATMVVAVRVSLHDVPRIGQTAKAMAVLLPLTGIVITPLTMVFAWSIRYSTAPMAVVLEVAMVLAALLGATMLARHWAMRTGRPALAVSH